MQYCQRSVAKSALAADLDFLTDRGVVTPMDQSFRSLADVVSRAVDECHECFYPNSTNWNCRDVLVTVYVLLRFHAWTWNECAACDGNCRVSGKVNGCYAMSMSIKRQR